jgi:16S rRNA (cytosine1402-N4)-methyltransferase
VCEDADEAARAHRPVLADEVTFLLRPRDGGWVVDGTVGMGGHSERLMESGDGPTRTRLLGIDADSEALRRAGARLARFGDRVVLRQGSFRGLGAIAADAGITEATAILLDLGMSSYQLGESGRGFSFQGDEELDMRFDPATGPTAADLLNRLPVEELARIIFEYGEERHARRIARGIDDRRQRAPLARTADLVGVVKGAVPRAAWPRRLHVATRTFQAIRIAVNDEMQALTEALPQAASLLAPGGRFGVISFHSGEDRIVKRSFRTLSQGGGYVDLEPAPIEATADEILENPRARSAKLRVLERVAA